MSNQFKTKEFQELQTKWYKKLQQKGFNDIERTDKIGKAAGRLKTDALENVSHSYSAHQFSIKEEYYRLAGQFLHEHKFKTQVEKKIWELHSEGVSVRNIIKKLRHRGVTAYKDLVHGTIKRLAKEMKEHARSRQTSQE